MKTFKTDLSVEGIEKVIRQLETYKKSLARKNRKFVKLLLEKGISVAQEKVAKGTHTMPSRIRFEKQVQSEGRYTLGWLIGTGDSFPSDWIDAEGNEHIDIVKPLAMMEFGSAAYALPPQEAFGGYGGQGTFSVSGNENKSLWYVTKIDEKTGEKKRVKATAIAHTQPMYNAMLEMQKQIVDCAKAAFGGDAV